MAFGFGFGLPRGGNTIWSPASLFAQNEPGVWYDPSDMTTLFQDAEGTTPVTAVEQPVGLMRDKSGNGNHATSLTTSRPVLTARVNLLTKTEQFDDAVWTASKSAGASVSANTTVAPNGTTTADTVTFTASSDYLYQAIANYPAVTGASVTFSIYAKTATQIIVFGGASPAGTDVYAFVNAGNGWFKQTVTRTFTVTTSAVTLQTLPIGTFVGAGSFPIWGASLTTADQASLGYQRVNTATDYDTVGFPMWLKADGVDDYMVTGTLAAPVNLNLSSTDKVTVATGVRKLSNAATGVVTELSATADSSSGAFYLAAPVGVNLNYQTQIGPVGARVYTQYLTYTAPITNVISFVGNAALSGAAQISTRINGIVNAGIPTVDNIGMVGNFGTYPLYQFRRAGTSLPFNGLSAGLTVVGRTLTAAELSQLETYYQQKTKAY